MACALRSCFITAATRRARCSSPAISIGRRSSAAGVRWFHSGGIFAALSQTTGELIIEAMKAAKAAGAVTSFDLNYREKLWKISGGGDRAVETLGRIVENVDVLVGNEEDLQKGLGVAGPAVEVDFEAGYDRVRRHDGQRG